MKKLMLITMILNVFLLTSCAAHRERVEQKRLDQIQAQQNYRDNVKDYIYSEVTKYSPEGALVRLSQMKDEFNRMLTQLDISYQIRISEINQQERLNRLKNSGLVSNLFDAAISASARKSLEKRYKNQKFKIGTHIQIIEFWEIALTEQMKKETKP